MEKKALIIFDDGLREAYENPFRNSQKLKGLIENITQDYPVSFVKEVVAPFFSVARYICNTNTVVFKFILNRIDSEGAYNDSHRLKPSEIFDVLMELSETNSSIILDRLDCNDGILNDLKESISQKNRDKFIEIIRNNNSKNITPYIVFFGFPNAVRRWIEKNLTEKSAEERVEKYGGDENIALSSFISDIQHDSMPVLTSWGSSKEEIHALKKCLLKGREYCSDYYWLSLYRLLVGYYCSSKEEELLQDEECAVLEAILNQPDIEDLYATSCKEYQLDELEDKLKEFVTFLFPELAPCFPPDVQTEDITDTVVEEGTDEDSGPKDSDCQEETKPLIQGNQVPILEKRAGSWPLPTDFFEHDFIDFSCPIEEYFPNFLKNIGTIDFSNEESVEKCAYLSKGFSDFINDIAGLNYIENNDETKLAFAHALTGRKVKTSVSKVEWKRPNPLSGKKCDWLNDLCFMVRELYPQTISGIKKYEHLKTVFAGVEKNLQSSYADNARGRIKGCVDKFLNCARKNLSK